MQIQRAIPKSRKVPAMRVIATLLCLTLAISAGSASADWTLCVGDDGHTTFELAHTDSDCLTEERRHHPNRSTSGMHGPSHHGCRDVPLVEGASEHVSSQRQAVAPAMLGWKPDAPQATRNTSRGPTSVAKARDKTLLCRQSVVLIL